MTQIRFSASDPDHLRVASKILDGIERQLRAAMQTAEHMPQGAFAALTVLAETRHNLDNWATLIETERWRLLLDQTR